MRQSSGPSAPMTMGVYSHLVREHLGPIRGPTPTTAGASARQAPKRREPQDERHPSEDTMHPGTRPDPATTSDRTSPTARPRDVRGFWRVLLAVIAPLPMLAQAVYYLLNPIDGGASFAETVTAYTADQQLLDVLRLAGAVFVVGLPAATFAVIWAARRGAPRLTSFGAFISLLGSFSGIALIIGGDPLAYHTVRSGLDVGVMTKLSDDVLENDPVQMVAGLLFIVGIVIGLLLLGLALWRSRVAPAWTGFALAVGGFTHPFLPGHVAQGVGLLVAAAGFAGASYALLRMRNDDFDLPPLRPATSR
ncbi:hypothetical protein [Microtetraspora malaysiensis]|uniref:hypothetical protein n=1 Tax=Microtetraspora malaysiensis TaxID=161358 RepID=UPI0012F8FBC6|nr:hypothetical protein [Microtetraspora malaysiensis]